MSAVGIAEKICTKCGTTKPLDEFYRAKTGRDGRTTQCAACGNADSKRRQAKRRILIGDKKYRAEQRSKVRRHRKLHGLDGNRAYMRARGRAIQRLIDRHRDEYDALLAAERERVAP